MGAMRWIALIGLLSLGACSNSEQAAPPPPNVTVAAPITRMVTDWDEYVGRFEAVDNVQVLPRVSGQIVSVNFRQGIEVHKGQALFEIDPRPYRAAYLQAEAAIQSAAAALANARSELKRAEDLKSFNAVSQQEYETRVAAQRTAEANLEAARANAEVRKLDLSFTTVRSPINGRVSDKRVAIGDQVKSDETLLTTIVSVNPIWFSFEGAEAFYLKYIRQAREGERRSSRYAPNPVEIQLSDENEYRWRGRMAFVDNAIDTGSGTIRAHAVVANPDGFLVPGMFGRARLLGSGAYKAALVPDEAVLTDQTRKLVYLVGRDGKTTSRPVETGPMVEGLRVIRSGLKPGEKIIIEGLGQMRPGMVVKAHEGRIKPRAADTSPDSRPATAPPAEQLKPAQS
jgi:RND family efflux transporter MFP subunit